jgi:hypothetical protein
VTNLGDVALMVATSGMVSVAATGCYSSLYVLPEYFADPPASLRRFQADTSWRFWLPLHAVTLGSLTVAAVAEEDGTTRTLVLTAAGCYAASWIATAVWFIPGVIAFSKVDVDGPPSQELRERGRRWLRDSNARLVLMAAAASCLTVALGTRR